MTKRLFSPTRNRRSLTSLQAKPRFRWYDLCIVIPIVIFCYFSYNHSDLMCTASHGRDLLECILNGTFFEFYDYTQSTAVYSITIYLLFAVWSIPVKLVYMAMGKTMWGVTLFLDMPYPVTMWYKLLPTLCYVLIAVLVYKILVKASVDRNTAKWVSYLFLASPISIFSQFIFGQYDSLGLLLMMLALHLFLQKKLVRFSIVCSIAITFKMFALIFFLPLLLLAEKRILHIIKHVVIAAAGYVITSVMFRGSQGYADAMEFSGGIIHRLFLSGIETIMGMISLFTVAFMAICVYAYNKRPADDTEFFANAIYLPFFSFGALFAFILWHPQWVMLMIPFMAMACVLNRKSNSSLILMLAMGVGYLGTTLLSFPGNVDANMLNEGFLGYYLGERLLPATADLLKWSTDPVIKNVFYSFFAGSILLLLWLTAPTKKNLSELDDTITRRDFFAGDRIFLWLLPISVLAFAGVTLLNFFYLL